MSQGTFEGFDDDYEKRKERSRKREADMSKSGREIGPLPEIPPRGLIVKEACERSLRRFLEFFLPAIFRLKWSNDHLTAIEILEDVILNGGQFAFAMPRGNGKSSLSLGAVVWAMVYGHRRFLVPVCATGPAAERFLESIKTIIETNTRLAKVFPEVCYPISRLDGINNRTGGQILGGERTRIKWTGKRLILPTVTGSKASGVIVHAAGLLGSVRGLSQAAPEDAEASDADEWWADTSDIDAAFEPEPTDGGMERPDFTVLDDPQTDESARHPAQTEKRKEIISKAILNLAGPDKKIAAVMPCTVIQPDDLADQLLDKERNPEWRGRRTRLLSTMPDEATIKLWRQYREIRETSLRQHEDIRLATEYYRETHGDITRGVVASWPERFESEHVDAIQYALERWCKSEEAFFAEYQNEPLQERQDGIETLVAKELLGRCDGSGRGEIPDWATRITAFADVQQDILPWVIVAWGADLRGRIIDYGGWPKQSRSYYTLREVTPTLRQVTKLETVEAAVEQGLAQLAEWIFEKRWANAAGVEMGVDWFGVDANWELSKQIVYSAARVWPKLKPCHGKFVGASSLPMDQWKRTPGERRGMFWRLQWIERTQTLAIDSNSWKTLVCKRLQDPTDRGITWFGNDPHAHRMLCDQLSSEFGVRVVGRGRKVDEWKNRPGRDNHWWDCLVGAAAGASVLGVELSGQAKAVPVKRVKASTAQAAKRLGRK